MKKILIFGQKGQVASSLIKEFSGDENFQITSFSSAQADFAKIDELKTFLKNLKENFDFIINASAYTAVDKAESEEEIADLINHKAVAEIANYAKETNAILIHYSTDYVFDGSGNEPFSEDNTKNLNPINVYGKTKLAGERAIKSSACKHIIFRVSWVYSKDENHKNFYNTIKRLAKEKEELTIIDDQIGTPNDAADIAKITKNTIEKIIKGVNFSGIYHITNEKYISWYDFAVKIVEELKNSGEKLMVKSIKPIKSQDYKTPAKRPLNSRLKTKVKCIN
jgi:dTDP-4-dehydrorhamnose reductase